MGRLGSQESQDTVLLSPTGSLLATALTQSKAPVRTSFHMGEGQDLRHVGCSNQGSAGTTGGG